MARLTQEQIQTILKEGGQPAEIGSCLKHDIRARFHTEPTLDSARIAYKKSFIDWVAKIINKAKLSVFDHVLTLPIETVEFTEGVFDELKKVFEAQDRHIDFRFTNPELANDFDAYLKNINDHTFWQSTGFETMKAAISSIVVCDLPPLPTQPMEGGDRFARPYYYMLDVQRVRFIHVDPMFKIEYLIFESEDASKLYVFDDDFYRTYKKGPTDSWVLEAEVRHDLGYTPARSFWTTPFERKSRIQKRGPHSNSLGKFDWLLLLYTFTKHVELYAGFPIDVVYEQRCEYKDAQGNSCSGGKISRMVHTEIGGDPRHEVIDCPNCKDKAYLGPGTVLTAPAMSSKEDPDLIKGMNRISADTDSLEYLLKRVDEYEADISINMIGYVSEGIREAMNKEQVGSMVESQINCLMEVRDNFQAIHKFVLETLARLRYGSQAVVSITCNYGSKWFIHSIERQQTVYKESKANGFANFELAAQFDQILATKYKNNPTMLERMRTLVAIEPYQNYTVTDLTTLNDKIGLNEELVRLKVGFANYVSRFEREFMNLGVFMQTMPFEVKVAFVEKKLLEYVEEDYPEEEEIEAVPPGTPPPGTPPALPANQPPPVAE